MWFELAIWINDLWFFGLKCDVVIMIFILLQLQKSGRFFDDNNVHIAFVFNIHLIWILSAKKYFHFFQCEFSYRNFTSNLSIIYLGYFYIKFTVIIILEFCYLKSNKYWYSFIFIILFILLVNIYYLFSVYLL